MVVIVGTQKRTVVSFLTSIKNLNLKGWLITVFVILILMLFVSSLLTIYTDSTTPRLGSFSSVSSLVGMYLAAKEYIDWLCELE